MSDDEEQAELRSEARRVILDGCAEGRSPLDILNEVEEFFDGDVAELF